MANEVEIESFKGVLSRLDTLLVELVPILKRGNKGLTAARNKARRFVLDETKSGPFDNLFRWDFGNFEQHLAGPQSSWRPSLFVSVKPYFHSPDFVPKLISEPASMALLEVVETLLDFVRGQTSPQEQRDARDKLLRETQNYLWHRGCIVQQGHHQLDRPMLKLLDYAKTLKGKQRRVLEIVIEEGGVANLCHIASDKIVDWKPAHSSTGKPLYSEYNAVEYHLNTKLSKLRPKWHLKKHDKEIRLEPGAVQRSQEKAKRKSE